MKWWLARGFKVPGRYIAAFAVGILAFGLILSLWPPGPVPPRRGPDGSMRVIAANLHHANPHAPAAVASLAHLDPDLLILLEWNPRRLPARDLGGQDLQVVLSAGPGAEGGAHGLLVAARPALRAEGAVFSGAAWPQCPFPGAAVRVGLFEEPVCVLGLHLPPPYRGCGSANDLAMEWAAETLSGGRLARDLAPCSAGDTAVVAGDLNALPVFPSLRRMLGRGMTDSYAGKRWRPVGTLSLRAFHPALGFLRGLYPAGGRIDYVLAGNSCDVESAWVVDLQGSDHRAAGADLRCP